MTFKEKFKRLMQEQGLTAARVADLTGLSRSSISGYIHGQAEPPLDRKRKLARALGVQETYFEEFLPAAEITADESINLPVDVAAKLMTKSREFVEKGLSWRGWRSQYNSNLFEKARVPMEEVLARYGIRKNRGGFISCPFHLEKTASCKIYEKSFYCFGCGAGGDAVSFVSKMERCTPLEAAKKLVPGYVPESFAERRSRVKTQIEQEQDEKRKQQTLRTLLTIARELVRAAQGHTADESPSGLWLMSMQKLDRVEWLTERVAEMEFSEFRNIYGEEVKELAEQFKRYVAECGQIHSDF